MSDLLAVDPSIRSPGAALFRNGVLIAADRIRVAIDMSLSPLERALVCTDAIGAWCAAHGGQPDAFATEWPQIYTEARNRAAGKKTDPNDLIAMAAVDGCLATALHIGCTIRGRALRVFSYKPAEWIGQLPKATKGKASASPRAVRIYSRLSAAELAVVPDQHDAIDSVGLGLHCLGRLGVRRVYSNGTE